MANRIVLKKSSVAAKVPLTSDLSYGEMALNYTDGKLYFKDASNNIKFFKSGETSITNDTTTNGTRYLLWDDASSGSLDSVGVSSSKLTFNPSTGRFQSVGIGASSGIIEMANTISSNYTVSSGFNALSGGPIEVANGVEITIPDGSTWTVV